MSSFSLTQGSLGRGIGIIVVSSVGMVMSPLVGNTCGQLYGSSWNYDHDPGTPTEGSKSGLSLAKAPLKRPLQRAPKNESKSPQPSGCLKGEGFRPTTSKGPVLV